MNITNRRSPATRSTRVWRARCAAAGLIFAFVAAPVLAQDGPPPILDVVVAQVKGGMAADFEDRVQELQAARVAAGMPPMQVWSVVRGHPNEYHMVSLVPSLAEANSGPPPMPPGQYAAWVARVTSTVDSAKFFYARTFPDLSSGAPEGGPRPELMALRKTHVISGKQPEYVDWIANQYMPAFRQADSLGQTMSQGMLGDSDQNFYHAYPIANWAALDAPDPILAVLGERRGQQMIDAIDGIVENSEVIVLRYRYDLMGGQ